MILELDELAFIEKFPHFQPLPLVKGIFFTLGEREFVKLDN